MGLIAWYPLNGDLKNYGIEDANLIQGTAPAYVNGKIGKSLSAGGAQWNAETTNRILNHDKLSFCFWWKNLSNDTDRNQIFGNDEMTTAMGGRKFSLFRYPTRNDLHWSWQEDGNLSNNTTKASGVIKGILPDNEWVHICITYNNPTAKLYVNGKYYQTLTSAYNIQNCTFTWQTQVIHNSVSRNMNDLRFYDECLSKEQIHQISQGLILHYPLNSGYGNENLIIGSGKYTKNSPLVRTENAVDGWQKESTLYTNTIEAGTYTLQAKTDGNWHNHSTPSGGYSPDLKYCSIWLVSDAANNESGKDINICLGQTVPKSIVLSYKGKYWIRTNLYSNGTDNLTINFWDFKLEKGEKCSLWSPNQADNLYSQLGYDSTIMYDTSGLENNGIINNKPTSIGGGVIGNGCLKFNGNNQYISAGRGAMVKDAITINIWVYMDNWSNFGSSNMRIVSCTQGGGWNFEPKNGYLNFAVGVGTTTNSYMADFASQIKLADISSGWHMITGTFDGINKKIYFDGILKGTVSLTTKTPIFYNSTNGIFIAAEAGNDLKVAEGNYFNGKLNDFRIYSTALSTEDIKQLYQTKAKIDKNGNVYCNQFIDNDYEEELLTTQKMTFHQANSQGTITYETNGNEVINIITMDNTISSWKYLFNNAFDKTKIINHKLKLSFKYKTNVSTAYSMAVKMCKGDSTKPQTINIGSITLSTNWQEYNGIITFGNTYDNQGIYIHTGNFCGGNLYIKDLSLKIYENNNKTDFTKKSQIITGELSELDSNKTYVYKNSKIVTNQIIEN